MSRVPEVVPDDLSPEQRKFYDQVMATRSGKIQGPSSLWVRNASIGGAASQLANTLRRDTRLAPALFELITLIVARQWSANYVWVVHAREAEKVGLDPAIIEAIRLRRVPPFTDERMAVIYEMANELVETKELTDATYQRAEATFGVDLILEIVTTVGVYTMVAMTLKAFDAPAPDNVRPLG
jgi:4-carboxymuconolactone decarboxylase